MVLEGQNYPKKYTIMVKPLLPQRHGFGESAIPTPWNLVGRGLAEAGVNKFYIVYWYFWLVVECTLATEWPSRKWFLLCCHFFIAPFDAQNDGMAYPTYSNPTVPPLKSSHH